MLRNYVNQCRFVFSANDIIQQSTKIQRGIYLHSAVKKGLIAAAGYKETSY